MTVTVSTGLQVRRATGLTVAETATSFNRTGIGREVVARGGGGVQG